MSLHSQLPPALYIPGPLGAIAALLTEHGMEFEKEGEVIHTGAVHDGLYCPLNFTWLESMGLVHVVSCIELEVPEVAFGEVERLTVLCNQKMYIGHFEHRPEAKAIALRYGMFVEEGEDWRTSFLLVINTLLHACATYRPAFLQVVQGIPAEAAVRTLEELSQREHPGWGGQGGRA